MNKNGWGLRVELLIILMFLICLVIAVIGLNRLGLLGYNENAIIDNGTNNESYSDLENKLVSATKEYFSGYLNRELEEDVLYVRSSSLYYTGYLKKLYDEKGNECSGYVQILKVGEGVIYRPYLKCKGYKTDGYDGAQDW